MQILPCSLQNYEMQEELEEESLEQLREDVAAELAEQHQGDAVRFHQARNQAPDCIESLEQRESDLKKVICQSDC